MDELTAHSINLSKQDWSDIDTVASKTGVGHRSTALRMILAEWRELRGEHYELNKTKK